MASGVWLALALAMAPGSGGDAAAQRDQAALKALLEKVRNPVVVRAGEPEIPGVRATVQVDAPEPCRTVVSTTIPAFQHSSYSNPKPITQSGGVRWTDVEWTRQDDTVVRFGPSYPTLRYLKAATAAEAAQVKALADRLVLHCRGVAPASAPKPPAPPPPGPPRMKGGSGIGAWTHIDKDPLGYARCRFDRVAPLVLRQASSFGDRKTFADFEIRAQDGGANFTVRMTRFPGRTPAKWAEAYAVPVIKLPLGTPAKRGRLTVDGLDAGYEFDIGSGTYSPSDGFGARPVMPRGAGFPGWEQFLNRVAAGSTAELELYDQGNRSVARHRFDVSLLRDALPALSAVDWVCPAPK